ncbi:NAD(P)H-hydrate dehydratase [Veillonella criceti]|uniref:Bifunctional NAD(P)H-hydrate repair enzyme n=1 Tax=Veillonella criceti TaxID=103891 RepID=A0A380NHC0_9FIRM|nr:NAD(P)H-hydrate dehydratase [Veillonella criceti]SUP40730.1 Nicotinamide nucleotide repair protein [Veillonella criceti]
MRILTKEEAKFIDQWAPTKGHLPLALLMENAGRGVAEAIVTATEEENRSLDVVIVAGKGNNGADGLVAARQLEEWGHEVRVVIPCDDKSGSPLFQQQLAAIEALEIPVLTLADGDVFEAADVIVDGLLGTGLQGELQGPILELLDRMEAHVDTYPDTLLVAIDVPSGLNANTGAVAEGTLGMDLTVTFGAPKQGMCLYPGKSYCGEIIVKGLGFAWETALLDESNEHFPTELITAELIDALLPEREPTYHKGSNGHTLIIGGSDGMIGAPLLAAEAAVYAGAGKVTTVVPSDCLRMLQTKIMPEVMTGSFGNLLHLRMHSSEKQAVAIGPGLGRNEETTTLVKNFMTTTEVPLVIDADALWALGHMDIVGHEFSKRERPVIMTPHLGEFARLTGLTIDSIEANRIEVARQFAIKYQVVLVLKGAPTVVASPDGLVAVNSSGNEGMGTGGMGDTLTGIIASLLGQGLEEVEAAMAGVFLHGAAADFLYETRHVGFMPSEVARQVPYIMTEVVGSE